MRILTVNPQPIVEIPFLNAGRGPGGFYEDRLPVLDAIVDRLPDGASAIIAAADLQGRERFPRHLHYLDNDRVNIVAR